MSLGLDKTIAATEFVEAMRARLVAQNPTLGPNVDDPAVRPNLEALGQAVFKIATVHAETVANGASDAQFWAWVAGVQAWVTDLAAWQTGVRAAFNAWTPAQPAEQTLKAALLAVPDPPAPPAAAPTALRGTIE
jgi:hypothetical protein